MALLSAIQKWKNADIVLNLPTSKERFLGWFWVWLFEIDPVTQSRGPRCLIPWFDGAIYSLEWK
jgi:hypothetical protein